MRVAPTVVLAWLCLSPPAVADPAAPTIHRLRLTASLPLVLVDLTPIERSWFALDTGATGSTVTPDLADRLGLDVTDRTSLGTIGGTRVVGAARLTSLAIAGRTERYSLQAAVHDLVELRRLAPDAEGILGQDVLARYDYLIDFASATLLLGRFDPPPRGIDLPLSWSAGRPLVHVEGRSASHGLVLDTGADALYIEAAASRDAIGMVPIGAHRRAAFETHLGSHAVDVERHASLRLACLALGQVDVVRLPARLWRQGPEVGLLPAAVFRQVYVSARGGRARVWTR